MGEPNRTMEKQSSSSTEDKSFQLDGVKKEIQDEDFKCFHEESINDITGEVITAKEEPEYRENENYGDISDAHIELRMLNQEFRNSQIHGKVVSYPSHDLPPEQITSSLHTRVTLKQEPDLKSKHSFLQEDSKTYYNIIKVEETVPKEYNLRQSLNSTEEQDVQSNQSIKLELLMIQSEYELALNNTPKHLTSAPDIPSKHHAEANVVCAKKDDCVYNEQIENASSDVILIPDIHQTPDQCIRQACVPRPPDNYLDVIENHSIENRTLGNTSMSHLSAKREDVLKRHKQVLTGATSYACDLCQHSSRTLKGLKKHIEKHIEEKLYSCNECQHRCTTRSALKKHIQKHNKEKPYYCSLCQFTSNYAGSMKRHIVTHTREKPHCCNVCQHASRNASDLRKHMKVHSGEKPYTCNVCQRAWRNASNLKRHMTIHTGEKSYACNICQHGFRDAGDLKRHMRIHTGEKPYICNICQHAFRRSSYLKIHMRIHTGERPYTCGMCQHAFISAGDLKRHMRIHTGEKHSGTCL